MLTYYFKTVQDETLQTLEKPRSGVWAHAVSPTEEETEALITAFGVDKAILEDAQDFFEVPRLERSGSAVYFFTRYPYDEVDEDIDTAPLLIVVGETFVLTVVQREVPFLAQILKGKFPKDTDIATTQKAKFFIQIMSRLTVAYERELTRMRKAVYKDRARLRKIRTRDIERLVSYEHTLNDALAAIVPTNAWLNDVLGGNHVQLFSDDIELIEDLRIANNQLIDSARSILKTIQNIRGASEAILTNALNNTMKTLTALTILLTVPTIVASIYGMNVALPLQEHSNAFWLVIVLVVMIVSLVTFFFIRNRWL